MPSASTLLRVAPSASSGAGDESAKDHYDVLTAAYSETSCFIFTKSSPIRKLCVLITHNKLFETFIFFVILCNCVTLALSSNRQKFDTTRLGRALAACDYVYVAIFTLEMVLKIISMGFVSQNGAYLRDGWNVLDFLIVMMSYVGMLTPTNFTGLRTIRALRPLRAANRVKGMKVLVTTLIGSLPMLLDVLMLSAFTFFVFGIIAVQLFGGVLRFRCGLPDFSSAINVTTGSDGRVLLQNVSYIVPDDQSEDTCSGPLSSEMLWYLVDGVPTPEKGSSYVGRVCDDGMYCAMYGNPTNGYVSYDNILWSWLNIFQHITMSSWTDVMYMVMDAVNYWVWIFYVGLIIFGSFFMVNMALAVLSLNFSADNMKQAEEEQPNSLGKDGGEDPGPEEPPANAGYFRLLIWRVANSKGLEFTTAALIIVNTVVMCVNWYLMPAKLEQAVDYMDYALTAYFLLELLVRICGHGFKRFVRDGMNIFDALVVIISMVELIVDLIPSISGVGPLSVLRTFRLLRVFRLARHWKEFNSIILGMFKSVTSSIMLVLLMLLFMFVAALIGMQIFGYKFMFCDYVEGAMPICPLGLRVWGQCPDHFHCYLPCEAEQYGELVDAPGSFYNGRAYCDRFCAREGAAAAADGNATAAALQVVGIDCEYLAMVGKSQVPRAHFDNVFWGIYTVFQIFTGENWNDIMVDGMRSSSDWASLYFVAVIVVGNYLIFNLFIAILLDNLSSTIEVISDSGSKTVSNSETDETAADEGRSPQVSASGVATPVPELREARACNVAGAHGDSLPLDTSLQSQPTPGSTDGAPAARGASEPATAVAIQAAVPKDRVTWAPNGNGQAPTASHGAPRPPPQPPPSRVSSRSQHVVSFNEGASVMYPSARGVNADGTMKTMSQTSQSDHGSCTAFAFDDEDLLAEELQRSVSTVRIPRLPPRRPSAMASLKSLNSLGSRLPASFAHLDLDLVLQGNIEGRSLLLFGPNHRVRQWTANVVHSSYFEWLTLTFILASCVCLMLEGTSLNSQPKVAEALRYLDFVFTGVFTSEAVLKILTFGFAFTGRHAYIRDSWNVLDFVIVLIGFAIIILDMVGVNSSNIKMLRILRALRALRPLRAARRFDGLRKVVNSLFAVLPAMGNVALVCLLFYLIFAILAVNLFKGKLYNCIDADSKERLDAFYVLPPGQVLTAQWCRQGTQNITNSVYYTARNVSMPAYEITTEWIKPVANFDNVGIAMLTLFQAASLSLWVDITFSAVDATGVGEQPIYNHNPALILFFVFFIVVCSFFVLNLFISVTLEKFAELHRDEESTGILLTTRQQLWVDVQKLLLKTDMQYKPTRPANGPQRVVYDLVTHRLFELLVMVAVLVNIIFMAMVHVDMAPAWVNLMSYSNLAFTAVFALEALLKGIAFGPLNYLHDGWNCFDLFLVVVSVTSVVLDFINTKNLSFMPALRVLRVARVFRLIRNATGMQMLLRTIVISLPSLANVGGVMLMFFFIFAVIGVNLFAGIKKGENLTRHANFDSFPNAMLLLFRMLTGESWDAIMQDCMVTSDCVLVLSNTTSPTTHTSLLAGSYYDPGDALLEGVPAADLQDRCPLSPAAAIIYFPAFLILCTLILLQLVIAVLLENLVAEDADEELPVTKSSLESFLDAWCEVDGFATGMVHAAQLNLIVSSTWPPLGTRGTTNSRVRTLERLTRVDIPLYEGNKVSFIEVLHALSGSVCATSLPEPAADSVHNSLARRLPPCKRHDFYNAAHYQAADTIRAAIRGFLLRHKHRDELELNGLDSKRAAQDASTQSSTSAIVPRVRNLPPMRVHSSMIINGKRMGDIRRQLQTGSSWMASAPRSLRLTSLPPLKPRDPPTHHHGLSTSQVHVSGAPRDGASVGPEGRILWDAAAEKPRETPRGSEVVLSQLLSMLPTQAPGGARIPSLPDSQRLASIRHVRLPPLEGLPHEASRVGVPPGLAVRSSLSAVLPPLRPRELEPSVWNGC